MLIELTRLRVLTSVVLGPLSQSDTVELTQNYLGGSPDAPLIQTLHLQSEGNPFFAEELLRDWRESGALRPEREVWRLTPLNRALLPQSITSAVEQRLSRQPVELIEALVQDNADGTFTFRHNMIREALYAHIRPSRRQHLHGLIGQALEARPDSGVQHLAALALHFARSGEKQKGADYARQAAHAALAAYAPDEAIAHFETALGLIDHVNSRRGEILTGFGEALMLAGREREAVTTFEAARVWHKQAGDALAAARAAHRLGQTYWRLEDIPNARLAFETALTLLKDQAIPEKAQVMVDLGSLLAVSLHQQAEGIALGQQALKLAHQLEEVRLVASSSRAVGNLLVRSNNLRDGIPLLEQALRLARTADDPAEGVECCANLTLAYAWSTDFQRAHDTLRRWEALAKQMPLPVSVAPHLFAEGGGRHRGRELVTSRVSPCHGARHCRAARQPGAYGPHAPQPWPARFLPRRLCSRRIRIYVGD